VLDVAEQNLEHYNRVAQDIPKASRDAMSSGHLLSVYGRRLFE
jgi:hypothetical protein